MAACRKVALVKGEDRYSNICNALNLIKPDLEKLKNAKKILIKPNLTATSNAYANTDVKAVEAVIDFLYGNFGAEKKEISVFEGSGSAYYEHTTTRAVFEKFGYAELEKKYRNVKLEAIEDFSEYVPLGINSIAGKETVNIAKHFFNFDYRISVAIPKTHNYAMATFGIKNMAGLIRQQDKSMMHGLKTPSAPNAKTIFTYVPTSAISWMRRRMPGLVNLFFKNSMSYLKAMKVIHHNIAAMAKMTWPDLVVLDSFYAMDGNGPVDGFPVKLNAAIASADALKADCLGARIMGLQPDDIGYLHYLSKENLGDMSLEGFAGNSIEEVRKKFKMHPTYSIQKRWREF